MLRDAQKYKHCSQAFTAVVQLVTVNRKYTKLLTPIRDGAVIKRAKTQNLLNPVGRSH